MTALWTPLGPTTSVMEVPGGVVVREERGAIVYVKIAESVSLCFIPVHGPGGQQEMKIWIAQKRRALEEKE